MAKRLQSRHQRTQHTKEEITMIAQIDKRGILSITPTNKREDMLLRAWYGENAKKQTNTAITFKRYGNN